MFRPDQLATSDHTSFLPDKIYTRSGDIFCFELPPDTRPEMALLYCEQYGYLIIGFVVGSQPWANNILLLLRWR